MRKFLFVTQPSNDLGLLAQSIPIATELNTRGHQITFCTSGNAPCKVISAANFNIYHPNYPLYLILSGDTRITNFLRLIGSIHLKRDMQIFLWYLKHMEESSTSEIWNIDHFMYIMGMCNDKYTQVVVESLLNTIVKYKPDAIVSFWNPFMNIAAKIINIPLISVIQADLHPQSKGFIWWKEAPINIPTPISAINKLMVKNHLPAMHSVGELSLGDLTLVLGIPETDPLPGTLKINYIGSLLLQNPSAKLPDWIENLRKDKPIVWLYPGNLRYIKGQNSAFDGMVILKSCIKVLRNMNIQVILSTGHHTLPKDVLPLPSNFQYAPFIPGLAMAERCDLMIHHGGYGSTQTCLYAGTPAVVIPTYSERESNARRVAALGAGEIVLPITDSSGIIKNIDTSELRSKIEHVLSDLSYKENTKKISEKLKNFGGAFEAANLIENFIC